MESDNQSAVAMMNRLMSSCLPYLELIREIVFFPMTYSVKISADYIPDIYNRKADLLSRLKINQFLPENPDTDREPTLVPWSLWQPCDSSVNT